MIDDFDNVKKELTELAIVINTFKSEAVQVRIVELLLGTNESAVDDERPARSPTARPKRKTKRKTAEKVANKNATTKPRRAATSGTGATALLSQLLAGDFFQQPEENWRNCRALQTQFGPHNKTERNIGKVGAIDSRSGTQSFEELRQSV